LEEVEVVFGSGAGARVKQAMGRRRSSVVQIEGHDIDEDYLPDSAVTLNHVPKFAKKRIRVDEPELKDA
jgi:hypothetical protein